MRTRLIVMVVVLLVATAVPAMGAPPATHLWDAHNVGCSFEGDFGVGEFYADVFGPDEVYADFVVWPPGTIPYEEIPSIVGNWELVTATFDGSALTVDIPLVDYDFTAPAGDAYFDGVLEPAGPTEVYEDRFRDGNRWVELYEEYTPLMATGSFEVALLGLTPEVFDLSSCWSQHTHVEEWSTNPNAYVSSFEGTELNCSLEADGYIAEMHGFNDDWGGFLDLMVWAPGSDPWFDDPLYWGGTEALIEPGALFLEFDLWEPFGFEPAGVAVVDAMLDPGDVERFDIRWQGGVEKATVRLLDVSGALTIPGVVFDLDSCFGGDFRNKLIQTNPQGPKPTGKAPVNDVPDGAKLLSGSVNGQTKATAFEPEMDCMIGFDGEMWPLPLFKTLWYTFEGTGESMTVDSAGSNFDTIVGVYKMEGETLEQVACVDDVELDFGFSLQAAATFDTADGMTYYVQVGGFGGQYGLAKLTMK